ncbi:MAG: magnesium transporter, partial [Atopococcus tabaci]|nr:magnesium transporter [Atopococcus tabaci]
MKDTQKKHELNLDQIITLLKEKDYEKFDEIFLSLHAYDQAQIFEKLTEYERRAIYYILSPEASADLFDMLSEDVEELDVYFYEMEADYAAHLLENMYNDNAVDVLEHLDLEKRNQLIALMDEESQLEITQMMSYGEDTAGSLLTTEFISLNQELTTQESLELLKQDGPAAEMIYYLYVVDSQGHFQGVVSLRDLVFSQPDIQLKEIMTQNIIYASVDDDQEDVAHLIRDYDFLAVPVVNHNRQLVGIITVDDIVDVIDAEAAEDYSGLAAVDVDEKHDSPFAAATNRMPWLISLLVLGMGTSSLISFFEGLVSQVAILAVFISLITGTAGNAGTQSLAVAIRRISSREIEEDTHKFSFFLNELTVGIVTGTAVGLAAFAIVGIWQKNLYLGIIVGVAMLFAVIVSTLAGSFVPILIEKLGFDPAVASGPFITTLTDLTSVLIYFSIASAFMSYL